ALLCSCRPHQAWASGNRGLPHRRTTTRSNTQAAARGAARVQGRETKATTWRGSWAFYIRLRTRHPAAAAAAPQPQAEAVQVQVHDRSRVQREDLAEYQAADDR